MSEEINGVKIEKLPTVANRLLSREVDGESQSF